MSNWLHYHPDGRVYIRDANDVPLYDVSAAEFVLDYGSAFPALAGVAQLEFFEGAVYGYDAKQNELTLGAVEVAPYQTILGALPQLLAARTARLTPPPQTAAQLRARNVVNIEAARDAALAGGVLWGGKSWHLDPTFQLHLTGLITAHVSGIVPDSVLHPIRTADNVTVQLGIADIKALAGTVLQRVQQIWQDSFAQKDALA